MRIELHGGFDHFGYELIKDVPSSHAWVLRWYTEGVGAPDAPTWPVGTTPEAP